MRRLPAFLALVSSIALGACSSDEGAPAPGTPSDAGSTADARDPTLLFVAGQYPTTVALTQNSCTGIRVEPMTTAVTHAAGSSDLLLVHAGVTYTGTIEKDGAFVTTPQSVGPASETHRLTINGRFSITGFEAAVSVDVIKNGAVSCAYTVSWTGAKTGEPNVIPG